MPRRSWVRTRWAAIGASIAVSLGGGVALVGGTGSSTPSSTFVPISPCRLVDTRPSPDDPGVPGTPQVDARQQPLGPTSLELVQVRGTNGNCVIPTNAVGVTMNVTIITPTARSYLTVFPADAYRPLASNLNWSASQGPTGNSVTARLSADGKLYFYNHAGTVHVIADIIGYYQQSSKPARIIWVAPTGGDFTSIRDAVAAVPVDDPQYIIKVAPGTYSEGNGLILNRAVHIEGSGHEVTTITCVCFGPVSIPGVPAQPTPEAVVHVSGAGNSGTLSKLSIVHPQNSLPVTVKIVGPSSAQFRMSDVDIRHQSLAAQAGVLAIDAKPRLERVSIFRGSGSGAGLRATEGAEATLIDVRIIGNGAPGITTLSADDATLDLSRVTATSFSSIGTSVAIHAANAALVTMRDSTLSATIGVNSASGSTVRIVNTSINGQIDGSGITCLGAFRPNLTAITCP